MPNINFGRYGSLQAKIPNLSLAYAIRQTTNVNPQEVLDSKNLKIDKDVYRTVDLDLN